MIGLESSLKWEEEIKNNDIEEREEFMRVNEDLTENWNYIAYNDFIRRMNAKYGE